uniref:ShKT domain-containing protein n=1 Tax=Strongyloides papillosus TaxID=174720 RepID=A0A0N5BD25_STREA
MKNLSLPVAILSTFLISFLYVSNFKFLAYNGFCLKISTPSDQCIYEVSNCVSPAQLCIHPIYRSVMAKKCSSACGTCDKNPAALPQNALQPPVLP